MKRSVQSVFYFLLFNIRCEIPGCDSSNPADRVYEPDWLPFTTPYKRDTGLPYPCKRYAMKAYPVNGTRCAPDEFDKNTVERCYGHWVFEDRENTVGTEVCTIAICIIYLLIFFTKKIIGSGRSLNRGRGPKALVFV